MRHLPRFCLCRSARIRQKHGKWLDTAHSSARAILAALLAIAGPHPGDGLQHAPDALAELGGFYTEEQAGLSHGAVVIAIAFFSFVPFLLWPQVPWLGGVPAILGFFEAFIHIAGIRIHKLPRPYSPGMATALLCLLPSAVAIVMFATPGIGAGGWALAAVCYVAIFACMEVMVWRAFGIDPRTLPERMRGIVAGK